MILYTVGNKAQYDLPESSHKAIGGSVWLLPEEAARYINRISSAGAQVQGAIYEVHLPEGARLEDWVEPSKGDFMTLTQNAKLGRCVQTGQPIDPKVLS